jgi:hypothetical protein
MRDDVNTAVKKVEKAAKPKAKKMSYKGKKTATGSGVAVGGGT